MKLQLFGQEVTLPDTTILCTPPPKPAPSTFKEVVCRAMDHPLDLKPLAQWDLKGKKIAVMVDDWGRPTPCSEFLPEVLKRLSAAGASLDDITVITASGMHDPMSEADLLRKVGDETFRSVRCVSHDAGEIDNLAFVGISPMGTPIWINKYVAHADVKLAFGRIFPHASYGYEGGYKMIVPGVASYETILRDHGINFSPFSDYGILNNNPSRGEADAVGKIVGIDFLVNFVMDWDARPIAAFGGTPEAVFPAGVNKGQRDVWCGITGQPADITVLCADRLGNESLADNPTYYLGLAMAVTKPDGIVIATMEYRPSKPDIVAGYNLDDMPFDQILRLHEKRDWNLSYRQIQHVLKSIRGAFYRRRIFEYRPQTLFLASETYPRATLEKWNARQFPGIQAALDAAMAQKRDPVVVVIPDGKRTLPLINYDYPDGVY